MSEPKALAPIARGRVSVREDVELVGQTKRQRRLSLATMFGGIAVISFSTVGSSTIAPLLFGAMIGSLSTKVRTMGRGRLLRWVRQLEEPRARAGALAKLEALATQTPVITTSVRMEAGGHAALARVEAGELDEAVAVLAAAYRDGDHEQRQRLPDQGFLGEAVHALLARLAPGSTAEVVLSAGIVSTQASVSASHPDFALVLAMLRALEGAASGGLATALSAWRELKGNGRASEHPVLIALVGAALHAQIELGEAVEDELLARIEALEEGARRALTRWYPRVAELGRQGYRAPAPSYEPAAAMVPVQLEGLSTGPAPHRWLPAVGRRSRVVVGIATGLFGINALMSLVTGDVVGVLIALLVVGLFTPTLISTPILRGRRAQLLVRAGVMVSEEDLRRDELLRMPARGGPSRGEAANLHPFDLTELRLLVGLRRAEQALAQGDREGARPWVQWWMDTAKEQGFGGISPLALGASALRVATLTGQRQAGEALAQALKQARSDPRVPRAPRVRTGYGDAPRAVSAALALQQALAGDWARAGTTLRVSEVERPIELDAFERDLYGRLARTLEAHEIELPGWFAALREGVGEGPGYAWEAVS